MHAAPYWVDGGTNALGSCLNSLTRHIKCCTVCVDIIQAAAQTKLREAIRIGSGQVDAAEKIRQRLAANNITRIPSLTLV